MTEISIHSVQPDVPNRVLDEYTDSYRQLSKVGSTPDAAIQGGIQNFNNLKGWATLFPIDFRKLADLSTNLGIATDRVSTQDRKSGVHHELHFTHPLGKQEVVLNADGGGLYNISVYEQFEEGGESKTRRTLHAVMPTENLSRAWMGDRSFFAERGNGDDTVSYHPAAPENKESDKHAQGYAMVVRDIAHLLDESLPTPQKVRSEVSSPIDNEFERLMSTLEDDSPDNSS